MRQEIPLHGNAIYYKIIFLQKEESMIRKNIEEGYFGQAISIIMQIIPKKYKKTLNDIIKVEFAYLCNRYLEILLPGITNMIYEVNNI